MGKPGQVTLADVEKALRDLGGEATRAEILDQLTRNRNGDISYYRDEHNYQTTAFQVIQQHCRPYKKQEVYKGAIRFERVGDRFRLAYPLGDEADEDESPGQRQPNKRLLETMKTEVLEGFTFSNPRRNALKLDEHDAALVASVKAALDAAILSAHMPSAVAKRIHSLAARHRMKGRAAAIKRHPFAGVCEASGQPLEKKFAQLDELDPELGYAGRVQWVCPQANKNGSHSCGVCK